MNRSTTAGVLLYLLGSVSYAQSSFVNWEHPQVHPLEITPDGTKLLAVNTPDNRLEVFDLTTGTERSDGVLNTRVEGFGAEFLSVSGDLAAWKKHHHGKHQIHTAAEITAAVERIFQITLRSEAPYLYRYISPMLPDDGNGIRILQAVLLREKSMIERGTIQAIGRRLVAVSDL